jgi:hypothetical protein
MSSQSYRSPFRRIGGVCPPEAVAAEMDDTKPSDVTLPSQLQIAHCDTPRLKLAAVASRREE